MADTQREADMQREEYRKLVKDTLERSTYDRTANPLEVINDVMDNHEEPVRKLESKLGEDMDDSDITGWEMAIVVGCQKEYGEGWKPREKQ